MRSVTRLVLLAGLLSLCGCQCGPRGPDSQYVDNTIGQDGGSVVGRDAGSGKDGGPGHDAGGSTPDSGTAAHDGGATGSDAGTDPCAGVSCNAPPAPFCVSGNTLRTWATPGTCTSGACSYTPIDTACPRGCANGACQTNTCTTPCQNYVDCMNLPGQSCDVSSGCCVPCGGAGQPCCVDWVNLVFTCNSATDVCGSAIGSGTGEGYYCCANAGDGCCEQGGCGGGTCCKCPRNGLNACVDPAFGCGGC